MFSKWRDRIRRTLGLRVAVWYAAIFLVSSVLVIVLTYLLLSASLQQRDRELIQTRVHEYASEYGRGGLDALARTLRAEQIAGRQEPLFVRVLSPYQDAVFFRMPADWGPFELQQLRIASSETEPAWAYAIGSGHTARLEVASLRLPDGTLVQVGKSTAGREQLLRRFRTWLSLALMTVVAIGLLGGALLTRSALRPVRDLATLARGIIRTGRVEARVPAGETGDALDELGVLVNTMLDRIEALVTGMRGALDNVAHDLRTPLTRLRSAAEHALEPDRSTAELRSAVADCLEESERVLTMLNTLMDISEAETGAMRLQRESLHAASVIDDAVGLYADVAEEKGVMLQVSCPQTLRLSADRNRLRQVLANLLDNAIKYTPAGGRVTIEAGVDKDGSVVIGVADTGVGILEGDRTRIWERLYRGDQSRSERGLGLGLSLVKAVVEAHGGRVAVESQPGAGSRFTIRLPASTPHDAPAS